MDRDLVEAYVWINLAAASGVDNHLDTAGALNRISTQLTEDEISEAKEKSQEWLETHH